MQDISFSIYLDNKIQKTTLQDLAKNRRVLFCSVVRLYQHLTDVYVARIVEQLPFYYANGIDEVYLISSTGGLYPLARFEKRVPEVVALYDQDREFINYVKNSVNKTTQTLDDLVQYWSYQVLINNGEIEQFYEQPTDNYIKHLVKAGFKPHKEYQKIFLKEGEKVALFRHSLTIIEQKLVGDPATRIDYPYHECNPFEFMYFNLCPNKKLNEYLLDTAKQTSV